jgi:allantoin racemase
MAHVRLITPITTPGFRSDSALASIAGPGLRLSLAQIEQGPASIESAYETAFAEPATILKIIEAERDGVDAVVIDCMADPGLAGAREAVSIPVLGPSQTSMHLAAMLGHTFSVITVLPRLRPQFETLAAVYGLRGKLASVRAVDIPVLELEDDIEETQSKLVRVAEAAIHEDGAHAIVFGCTGLMGCAAAVRRGLLDRGLDIPVVDPIPATLRLAGALVDSGLGHSKLTSPTPPDKAMPGYDGAPSRFSSAA